MGKRAPSMSRNRIDGLSSSTLHQADPGLELLRPIPHEARPMVGSRDQLFEVREHLAAVADPEAERVAPREETFERLAGAAVEQDRFCPAFAGSEHVAVGKSAARRDAPEIGELRPTLEEVAHVDVYGLEPGAMERGGHLDVTVHALLPQAAAMRGRAPFRDEQAHATSSFRSNVSTDAFNAGIGRVLPRGGRALPRRT